MRTQLKYLWLCALWISCLTARSQNLVQAMVYFDENESQAQYFPIANQASIDQPFTVNVAGLSRGVHTMYVKVKNADGRWSLYDRDVIQVLGNLTNVTLGRMEYFFDEDPGFGEGIQVPISGTSINGDFDLNVSGLTNGVHTVYIRVRDNNGLWSLYDKKMFQVVGSMLQPIVAMEYYYDVDPGFGNGNAISLDNFDGTESLELSVAGLSNGVHTLYIRVQDANGLWSLYDQANFTVTNANPANYLVHAEYYFDTDPGIGNGYPLDIPNAQFVDGDYELIIPSNLTGTHTVCIRVQNGNGDWSAVQCRTINICAITIPSIAVVGQNCQTTPYVLNAPSGYSSYQWSNGANTSSISVTEPGEYSVTVTQNGCSATTSTSVQFTLASPVQIQTSGSQCPGGVQTLTATGGFDSYLWSNGSTEPSITTTVAGNYTVQAIQNGCTATDNEAVVFVEVVPPTLFTNGAACEGQSVNISIPFAYSNVLWFNGETVNTVSVNTSGTYTVSAFNNGCPTSGSITLTFDTPPVFDISISGSLCQGDVQTLDAGNGYDQYEWSTLQSGPSIDVTQSGSYSVTVYNGDCFASQSVQLDLVSLPTPSITTNGNTLACSISGSNYQWFLNGVAIPGANSQFYQATQSGFYNVEISSGACSNSSEILNFTLIGIDEATSNEVQLYPNPTAEEVTLVCSQGVIVHVQVFDVSGKMVCSSNPNTSVCRLNTAPLASGTYSVRIATSEGQILVKSLMRL